MFFYVLKVRLKVELGENLVFVYGKKNGLSVFFLLGGVYCKNKLYVEVSEYYFKVIILVLFKMKINCIWIINKIMCLY